MTMRHIVIAAATTIISVGAPLSAADAADLYTTPPPPPTAEAPAAPPPVAEAPAPVAPPSVAVIPKAPVIVEPRCPRVWRWGYWGCRGGGACAPGTAGASVLFPSTPPLH